MSRESSDAHIVMPSSRPAYSDDGVDLTLIRWMLRMTPAERLRVLEGHVESMIELRRVRDQAKLPDAS